MSKKNKLKANIEQAAALAEFKKNQPREITIRLLLPPDGEGVLAQCTDEYGRRDRGGQAFLSCLQFSEPYILTLEDSKHISLSLCEEHRV